MSIADIRRGRIGDLRAENNQLAVELAIAVAEVARLTRVLLDIEHWVDTADSLDGASAQVVQLVERALGEPGDPRRATTSASTTAGSKGGGHEREDGVRLVL